MSKSSTLNIISASVVAGWASWLGTIGLCIGNNNKIPSVTAQIGALVGGTAAYYLFMNDLHNDDNPPLGATMSIFVASTAPIGVAAAMVYLESLTKPCVQIPPGVKYAFPSYESISND